MKEKIGNTQNNKSKGSKIKFSLLTLMLIICIIELSFGIVQNINKIISHKPKVKELENKRNEELRRNKRLKSEVKNFDSEMTLEAIARNNLKMAGEDEVLIIINKPLKQEETNLNDKENKQKRNRQ